MGGDASRRPFLTTVHAFEERLVATKQHSNSLCRRPIPGFPDYEIGVDGTVWSSKGNNNQFISWKSGWKQLKGNKDKNGYLQVALRRGGKTYTRKIHRLVLETYIGPRPSGMECRHFPDPDKTNNRIENLSWGTSRDNKNDSAIQGVARFAKGEASGRAKLCNRDVLTIRRLAQNGVTRKVLARKFKIAVCTVTKIVNRKAWAHLC